MQSSASINLVKAKVNITEEVIKWALTFGRLLVILTEIVAFSTFLLRFSLDRTLIDLHSTVKQEQALVASLKDREATYRNLQQRIKIAATTSASGNDNYEILNEVMQLKPIDVGLSSLTISKKEVTLESELTSISSLNQFIKSLRENKKVASVGIQRIENKSITGTTSVSILVKLK